MSMIYIYTNETCPYCKQVKEELRNNNIEFNERLTKDWPSKWQDVVNLTGMSTLPTIIRIDKEYTDVDHEENNRPVIKTVEHSSIYVPGRDFGNPQQLVSMINVDQCQESNDRQTFEKLKTLNYNIHTAFSRLDQLLKQIETKINTDEHKSTD